MILSLPHGYLPWCHAGVPRFLVCCALSVLTLDLGLLLTAQAQDRSRRERSGTPTRVALIIGNSRYAEAPLRNSVNDATDMAAALRRVGFAVTLLPDANQVQMETAVNTFAQQLSRDSVGLFYFSGHGVQVAGQNYLLPIGAAITAEADVKYKAVPAGWVQERMEAAGNALNMLILDACRNNPLTRQWRSSQQGLAPMPAGQGTDTIIAFSTQPGQVAADGTGQNSPYTKHLLQQLVAPGVQVEEVFKRVRTAVVQETKGQQRPQEWNSSTREFRFVEAGKPPVPETPVAVNVPPPPATSPAKTLRNSIGMEFVLIPAGTFQMGSNDKDASSDEKLVHTVQITQPFYLGKYEVTQGQWQAVMGNNPSDFRGDVNLPVDSVSWNDVQEFLQRLNAREGKTTYRLPTEAEWEYAARAGSTTAYSFGDDAGQLGTYAWYGENAGGKTHVIGQKRPNAWGLYDMHGNVWEWVQDWHGPYTSASVTDPQGPADAISRALRGGSWRYPAQSARAAYRFSHHPTYGPPDIGFRGASSVPGQ